MQFQIQLPVDFTHCICAAEIEWECDHVRRRSCVTPAVHRGSRLCASRLDSGTVSVHLVKKPVA